MLKNQITIILRRLKHDRIYSAINIAGLALGLACAIIVFLLIKKEYAVNRNFTNVEQLYRITSVWKEPGMGIPITTLAPVGPLMQQTFPEVIHFNRSWGGFVVLNVGDKAFREDMLIADHSFFQMFDFPFLAGDPKTAFDAPNSVVITEELAEKCFGRKDVLNETIALQVWSGADKRDYKITGVLKKLPRTSVTHYEEAGFAVFISDRNLDDFMDRTVFESWQSRYVVVFVELQKGSDATAVQAKIPAMLDVHCPPDIRPNIELKLDPLATLHLTDHNEAVLKTMRGQMLFAIVMVLIACINFVNLGTARSMKRAKEIGMRKVLGGQRLQLIRQFLAEAIVFALIALALGIGLVAAFIEVLNSAAIGGSVVKGLSFDFILQTDTIGILIMIALLTGLLAGSYPAFFLSSFNPVQAIQGGLKTPRSGALVRKTLVVIQFAAAIFLFISTNVISKQLHFMLTRDMGFGKENVLVLRSIPREWNVAGVQKQEVLKNELRKLPEVQTASLSFDVPADQGSGSLDLTSRYLPDGQTVTATQFTVDESYLETYDLQLLAGRFYAKQFFQADTATSIALNRTAAEALNLKNPVGEILRLPDGQSFTVIGVVENFSFLPLQRDDKPMAFRYVYSNPIYRYVSIKLRSDNITETIAHIESAWKRVYPDVPFIYRFIDEVVQERYAGIAWAQKIRGYSTLLASFVACLGLLGLAAYTAERRTKEIGIRKVLGASVAAIIRLLSKEFALQVLIAALIASPVSYYFMSRWLADYPYRVDIGVATLLIACAIALAVALLTVTSQAVKAALANPVDTLRVE